MDGSSIFGSRNGRHAVSSGTKIIGKAPVGRTRQECKRAILVTSSLRDLRVPPRSS